MISCETAKKDTVIITEEDLNNTGYRLNFMGFPFCFYTFYNYGMELIRQVLSITKECSVLDVILKFRYILVVGYFAACIISPRYAFHSDFSEFPLLIALFFDCYNLFYDFKGKGLIRFVFLLVITGGCLFLRKRSNWRILLNTWKEEDEDEEGEMEFDNKISV